MTTKSIPRLRKSVHFNTRLSDRVTKMLRDYAARYRVSPSAAAAQILEEGLRMEHFPGIDFRPTVCGREPFVTGTGLTVWEMFHIWRDHKEEIRGVLRNYPHLKPVQINAAVAYAKAFPREEPPDAWA